MAENRVITIGRQLGSGGSEIGREAAKRLGIRFYDRELIELACQYGKVDMEALKGTDERRPNPFLFSVPREIENDRTGRGIPANDMMFNLQSAVIRELASRESCILIGRSADYVLRELDNVRSVFVFSDMGSRGKRIMERRNVPLEQALNMIRREDKARRNYYECYTGKRWGARDSYDLSLNSGRLGIEGCVQVICSLYKDVMDCAEHAERS